MILESNHTKVAITEIRNKHFKGKDPQLVEKILKALTLLELLVQEKVDFTFKGGTCLLLLLPTPKRFSIDLDLIIAKKDDLIQALENICKNNPIFTRLVEDKRVETKIPKAHYKVYYKTSLSGKEDYVLVDLIEDANPYPLIQDSEIRPTYFQTSGPYLKVKTPTINCILGDKMTAFAPRTTGIKLGVEKEMEIAKQLFDVASLFDHATDFSEVKKSFMIIAEKEIKYRELNINHEDVLHDAFETAKIIALQGAVKNDIYKELQVGIRNLNGYIFENFGPVQVHICAAKSAYLTRLIHTEASKIIPFKGEDLRKIEITNTGYNKLNKVKKTSPEAFYYWKAATDLVKA
ncbi:MAG: nucleotidyl transferase AbiEii/AbiGii toxin family protein [Bacteriovoracaceae bacterium]|nr:nucleotidyl transferase AbiEii/AbiGii toxin family protein [Bacteriovoracaceae bacterium]